METFSNQVCYTTNEVAILAGCRKEALKGVRDRGKIKRVGHKVDNGRSVAMYSKESVDKWIANRDADDGTHRFEFKFDADKWNDTLQALAGRTNIPDEADKELIGKLIEALNVVVDKTAEGSKQREERKLKLAE
jgi:hypothetical protein